MKISIYAPYAKQRFETARQYSILYFERVVVNAGVIPRNCGEERVTDGLAKDRPVILFNNAGVASSGRDAQHD